MPFTRFRKKWSSSAPLRAFGSVIAVGLLFAAFAANIGRNPPGYYVDESALSYNAYLVAQTGAGESGVKFPLFFPVYTGPYTQYANPTQIYLLAGLFKVFGPGIMTARVFAAACVFAACLLLGLLARRISGSSRIGVAVGMIALATPWLYEVGRLVMETFFYPLSTVLLLWSVYRASLKPKWNFLDTASIVLSLVLLTYSYTIGRLLGPLLACGLILFATGRSRIVSIARVWMLYAITLVPLGVYIYENPGITTRFQTLSYVGTSTSAGEIAATFATRYLQDINPLSMLIRGDINPRHHLPGSHGSFLIGVFLLTVVGVAVMFVRHRRESWWLYIVFGLFASVVPGALTNDEFHTLRMVAYPVFLLVLLVPAFEWLSANGEATITSDASTETATNRIGKLFRSPALRQSLLTALITVTMMQAAHFMWRYHTEGTDRGEYFDAGYKTVYDAAVAQPQRPIYLVDGYWGPAYIHAYWYAALEGRGTDEFVHLPYHRRPPDRTIVLSSEAECTGCQLIASDGGFLFYIQGE